MSEATITFQQGEALRRYGRAYERAQGSGNAEKRMVAQDVLRAARRDLTSQEVAILDMVAGRGNSITGLVQKTGQPQGALMRLLTGAAVKLAEHFEKAGD